MLSSKIFDTIRYYDPCFQFEMNLDILTAKMSIFVIRQSCAQIVQFVKCFTDINKIRNNIWNKENDEGCPTIARL